MAAINEMKTTPKYSSGETIQAGDRVTYDDDEMIVEDIITEEDLQWDSYWSKFGTGIMLRNATMGRLYAAFNDEHLFFVGRATNTK